MRTGMAKASENLAPNGSAQSKRCICAMEALIVALALQRIITQSDDHASGLAAKQP